MRLRPAVYYYSAYAPFLMDACSFWSNTHQVTKTALSWRPFALCATSAFRLTIIVVVPHVVVAIPNLDGFTMMPCWTIEVYFSQTYPPRGRRNQILCVSNIVGDAALFAKNCDPA